MVKVVIGLKDGKCLQKEIQDISTFLGKAIGDKIIGDSIDIKGYEFQITGGSDDAGFPMNPSIAGTGRKKILAVSAVGLKKVANGVRIRKTVCGNTIHTKIAQINLKVTKEGTEPLVIPEKTEEKKQ